MSEALGMGGIHNRDSRAQILKYPRPAGESQSEEGKDYPSRGVATAFSRQADRPRVREQAGSGAILGAAL